MAAWCLVKQAEEKLMKALKEEGDPLKMVERSSEERHKWFAKVLGEENATHVNALFESKLLLKNQIKGFQSFIDKVGGSPVIKRDFLSKIENLNKALSKAEIDQYLGDYVEKRLGVGITEAEYKTVSDYSNRIAELKSKADKNGIIANETDRLNYGLAKANLEEYVDNLKLKSKTASVVEKALEVPGTFKSIQSSLDNSFFGRQGIKVLYNNPDVWTKNFLKSWGDIGKELKGEDAMKAVKADIYSRPNAINGKYNAGGYGLDVLSEEAYPSSLPSKIPVLGRLFKASESAYNAAALRMRADLADRFIKLAEENGVNTLVRSEAQPIGDLIGSLTGRGKTDLLTPKGAKLANNIFYSIKFLKSNFDTLLAPAAHIVKKALGKYETKGAEFAGSLAAKSSMRIIGTIASVLTIAKMLNPESVDEDPTSSNFGKIKMWGQWVDITGGMGAIVRLAARIALGRSKSSTGMVTEYKTGFGAKTALDEVEAFFEGKLSPMAGILRDKLAGELFGGEKFTWSGALKQVLTPLPFQNSLKILQDPKSEFPLGSIILEGLGLSTSSNTFKKDWSTAESADLKAFEAQIGKQAFAKANDDYNRVYNWWYNGVSQKDSFKNLSQEGKQRLITKAKGQIKEMIFKANNFKYKKPKTTEYQKKENETIKGLIPK